MKSVWGLALALSAPALALGQDQQLGARTKAMGGSYTAFEDDPVSIWLNPGGIATQPDQGTIVYNTYTVYEIDFSSASANTISNPGFVEPSLLPSYIGVVFKLSSSESSPMSLGICYARPFYIKYVLDSFEGTPGQPNPNPTTGPDATIEQQFGRFRIAYALDYRMKKAGEAGFLTHVAIGAGLDLGLERFEFRYLSGFSTTNNSVGFGGGGGILAALYDNAKSFKVNFGAAYQSPITYSVNVENSSFPGFNMPQQINGGLTFYLLDETPLRITVDAQWVAWSAAAQSPLFPGQPSFQDSFSYSAGVEYRISLDEKNRYLLFLRGGYRSFGAPWNDQTNLPQMGRFKLLLDAKASRYNIGTFGSGFSWLSESGKLTTVDLGVDVGGDSYNFAFGVTREF